MRLFRFRTYDDRYVGNWKQIAKASHKAVKRTCCLCRKSKSQEAHHVRYRDWKGAIAGRELPGVDVFPVCLLCHERLHRADAWTQSWKNPVQATNKNPVGLESLGGATFSYQVRQRPSLGAPSW